MWAGSAGVSSAGTITPGPAPVVSPIHSWPPDGTDPGGTAISKQPSGVLSVPPCTPTLEDRAAAPPEVPAPVPDPAGPGAGNAAAPTAKGVPVSSARSGDVVPLIATRT